MAVKVQYREAGEKDISALHGLIERAYRGDTARGGWTHEADLLGGQRTDRDALREIVKDSAQVILLAFEDTALAGCVQLTRLPGRLVYLGLLTVDPELQAAGLGKNLLAESEAYVRNEWRAKAIEMTVIKQRTELIAYYERRGYALTGEMRPFPAHDPRFGLPKTADLEFTVLRKSL